MLCRKELEQRGLGAGRWRGSFGVGGGDQGGTCGGAADQRLAGSEGVSHAEILGKSLETQKGQCGVPLPVSPPAGCLVPFFFN